MKKRLSKLIAFFLIFAMALPVFGSIAKGITAQAASPALNATSKKVYLGTTFQLELKNVDEDAVKSVNWRINRSSICKIDQTGLLTPVKYGTTTAYCDVTFKDGTATTLKCTVYVRERVEATSVTITNKTQTGLSYRTLYVGKTITIKKNVTPSSGVTDTAYYVSSDESIATVSTKGVIKAVAPGVVSVEVRYGSSKTDAMRADNPAVDTILVHVMEKPVPTSTPTPTPTMTPTPTLTPTPVPVVVPEVTKVSMVGSQEIQITFSEAVSKSSIISEGQLVSGTVLLGKDSQANDYGTIEPTLSKDGKTLTLGLSGVLNGVYSIVVSDKVKTETGKSFAQYAEIATWKDVTGPTYLYTSVGYTGWDCNINFSESIDISGMTIEGVVGTTDAVLVNYLMDASNYKLSTDKKSIVLDLSAVTSNKTLVAYVKLKGIRDSAGNTTANLIQQVTVRTDASTKAVASIVDAERISKTQIAVTYSSAIMSPGTAIYGSTILSGVVDAEDPTIVYYDIPESYQSQTGYQVVEFNGWYNYNASTAQTTSTKRLINFMLDTTPPILQSYELTNAVVDNVAVCKLKLTYNKDIAIASTEQYMNVKISSTNGNISSTLAISKNAIVEGDTVTYIFTESQLLETGVFQFTLPEGMVADKLDNYSSELVLTIAKNATDSGELPAPVSVAQDVQDRSVVYVTFANKLDLSSAEMVQNYYVIGNNTYNYPVSASVISQDTTGATVALTFASGVFGNSTASYDLAYELVINGVSGYNGTYTAITDYHVTFTAIENTPPKVSSIRMSDAMTIMLTMSEEVTGSIKVTATDTTTGELIAGTGYAIGQSVVYISLDSIPTSTTIRFVITENNLVDVQGNKADLSKTYAATRN